MFHKLLTRIIIVLLCYSNASNAAQDCPENCSCDNYMLKCGHESINNFDIGTLKSLHAEQAATFTSVDLSTNQLDSLNFDDFFAFTNMRTLKVEDNNISTLSGAANLTSLKSLFLAYNSIGSSKDISSNVFSGMPNLSELDLSSNSISNLPAKVFPKTLQLLKIGNNPLKKLSLENFNGGKNSSLISLDVEESPALSVDLHSFFIKDSPLENFSGSRIESVGSNLTGCVMESKGSCHYGSTRNIKLTNSDLSVEWGSLLAVFPNALTIDLSSNKIDHYVLSHWMAFLRTLKLTNNNIERLPNQMHEHFLNLRHLDLSENKITSINKMLYLSNIETLLLNENNISSIAPKGLLYNQNLKLLDLRNNRLKFLNRSAIPLDHNYTLRISDNPFECHCSWTINYEVLGASLMNPEGTVCSRLGHCELCPDSDSKKVLSLIKYDEVYGEERDPISNCLVSNHTLQDMTITKSKSEVAEFFTTKFDDKKESQTEIPTKEAADSHAPVATTVLLVLIVVVLTAGVVIGVAVLYRRGYFERFTTSIQQYSLQPR